MTMELNIIIYNYLSAMISYIDPQGQEQMRKFQYRGTTYSIAYKHLWSPFGDWLVQYVPENVHPNAITLLAFVILIVAHVIVVRGVQNGKDIDPWRLVVMAVAIILYQHLDILDGKQARKTKLSSPLGMLFDHGADAVSTILLSIQVTSLLYLQNPTLQFIVLFVAMTNYLCCIWAQYSVGEFVLSQINPVDQGLPVYALMAVGNIFLGGEFWNREIWGGFRANQIFSYLFILGSVPLCYSMVKDNYKKAQRPIKQINKVLLLPISYAITLLSLYFSPKNPFSQAYWPIIYILLFTWSRNSIQLLLYHVTKQNYNPINIGTLTFVIPSFIFIFMKGNDAEQYFSAVAVFAAIVFAEFVISTIRQTARILNINVFTVKKKSK